MQLPSYLQKGLISLFGPRQFPNKPLFVLALGESPQASNINFKLIWDLEIKMHTNNIGFLPLFKSLVQGFL